MICKMEAIRTNTISALYVKYMQLYDYYLAYTCYVCVWSVGAWDFWNIKSVWTCVYPAYVTESMILSIIIIFNYDSIPVQSSIMKISRYITLLSGHVIQMFLYVNSTDQPCCANLRKNNTVHLLIVLLYCTALYTFFVNICPPPPIYTCYSSIFSNLLQ